MLVPGTCDECCHNFVCTHKQVFWKDKIFQEVSALCRDAMGRQYARILEQPLEITTPEDWFIWSTLSPPKTYLTNRIDLTKTVVCGRPDWEQDMSEDLAQQTKIQPKIQQPEGLKKVCKSIQDTNKTTEVDSWWAANRRRKE